MKQKPRKFFADRGNQTVFSGILAALGSESHSIEIQVDERELQIEADRQA